MKSVLVFLNIAKITDFQQKKWLMSAEIKGCVTCFIYFFDLL